jgi:DNA-binding transcriptional ArsR family regulator
METEHQRDVTLVPSIDLLERVTRRMHVLSDPTRLRLLFALERSEACVQQLAEELGLVHRNVSHGLNLLYREGLLSRRREGTLVVYTLADYSACRLVTQATESVTAQIEELTDLITT